MYSILEPAHLKASQKHHFEDNHNRVSQQKWMVCH